MNRSQQIPVVLPRLANKKVFSRLYKYLLIRSIDHGSGSFNEGADDFI